MMGMNKVGIALVTTMLMTACAGTKESGQEQIGMNVKMQLEKIDELSEVHKARRDLLMTLEHERELAQLLWAEQQANFHTLLGIMPFVVGEGISEVQYTQPQLLRMHDYGGMTEMTEAYLQSLLAIQSQDHPFCYSQPRHQGFALSEGFEFPFRHRLTYSRMALDNGDVLQIPDVENGQRETDDISFNGDSYCYQRSFTADDPQPATVTGEFHAQLPDKLIEFEFTAADVGKTQEQDGYVVTLLELETGLYTIEIDAAEGVPLNFGSGDVLAEAVDAHGEYIEWWATRRQPHERALKLDDLLGDLIARAEQGTVDEATVRSEIGALRDMLDEQQGRSLYLSRQFHGVIDKALITLMVYSDDSELVSRELALPVHRFSNLSGAGQAQLNTLPQIPVTVPVYDDRAALRTDIVDLDAQQMQQRIETVQRLMKAPPNDYPAEILWFTPPVQSDILLDRRDRAGLFVLAAFDFYDQHGELVRDPTLKDLQIEDIGFETRSRRLENPFMVGGLLYYPERLTGIPVRVQGTLPIMVAPNLIKDSYSKDELPAGMTLNGNQLIVDYAVFEPREVNQVNNELVERRNQLFARDARGYLAEMKKVHSFHARPGRVAIDIYYFYGEPDTVEFWYLGDTEYVDYDFDIRLLREYSAAD
ncbi:hypothetical protein [Aliidiomarina soli]|uniref:Uncharacterized protein n=1 Tax=Aliidiomarina soli TaxID=1928574 RepID=A0A432WH97_9GAMM|nr:hypothetical protein [Aliidiomarina soli]RUO33087.1 hypothetical protein CWE14_07610 [Aliidiomarina soli]